MLCFLQHQVTDANLIELVESESSISNSNSNGGIDSASSIPHLYCGAIDSFNPSTSFTFMKKSLNAACSFSFITKEFAAAKNMASKNQLWLYFSVPRTLKIHQSILAYLSQESVSSYIHSDSFSLIIELNPFESNEKNRYLFFIYHYFISFLISILFKLIII